MKEKNKKVLAVIGPTAVGKTAASVEVALHFRTQIISADSRQCFRELGIGVAKPSLAELESVPHFFINSHSIHDSVHAALYESLSLAWASEIFNQHDVLILTGGTGLYVRAFCEGLDEIPSIREDVRQLVRDNFEESGLPWLQEQLARSDPDFFHRGEILNPQRSMRALEVILSTGRSIYSFRKQVVASRPFEIKKWGLDLPKEQLHRNINARVDKMMDAGLLDEVIGLMPYKNLNALQTVGYTELFDHLDGITSLDEAIELIKRNTRQYAKRQLTWFRKDKSIEWINPGEIEKIIKA